MIRPCLFAFGLFATGVSACAVPPNGVVFHSETPGAPTAFALLDNPNLSRPFGIRIAFCDHEVAQLEFDALMPAHQHGMNFRVDIRPIDGKLFEVANVFLHMPGLWELRVTAEIGGQNLDYTAQVTLE